MNINITVNGQSQDCAVEPRKLLSSYLREDLDLTGVHIGCDTSSCGACTVLLNGVAVKSCTLLTVQAEGGDVVTIEGLSKEGTYTPVQQAFWEKHGLQCGFCTPGMIMTATEILKNDPNPSIQTIREGLRGNLCRCTGYHNIVESIRFAAELTNRSS